MIVAKNVEYGTTVSFHLCARDLLRMFSQPELIDESQLPKEVLYYYDGHYLIDETNLVSAQCSKEAREESYSRLSFQKKLRRASTENKLKYFLRLPYRSNRISPTIVGLLDIWPRRTRCWQISTRSTNVQIAFTFGDEIRSAFANYHFFPDLV